MKKVLLLLAVLCLFSSAVFAQQKSWQEDLDGDGISEILTIHYEHAAQNIWKQLSVRKNGMEIFPQEIKVSFSEFLVIQDINPRFPGKEIITFNKSTYGTFVKYLAIFYGIHNEKYLPYNADITDKEYRFLFDNKKTKAEVKRVTPGVILAEYQRGTKFQKMFRAAKDFLEFIKRGEFRKAQAMCKDDYARRSVNRYAQQAQQKEKYLNSMNLVPWKFTEIDETVYEFYDDKIAYKIAVDSKLRILGWLGID